MQKPTVTERSARRRGIAKLSSTFKFMRMNYWLYIMCIPGILYFALFRYWPMWGVSIAFKDYNIWKGWAGSPWAGLSHFYSLFSDPQFVRLLGNTLMLSLLSILFAFPAPILLALFLNEIRKSWFKRGIQTLVYMPHFLSWVIVYSITYMLLATTGPINGLIKLAGGAPVGFLTSGSAFRPVVVIQTIWKESGWGMIVFLAALAGVDMEQYEAAIVDGAGRFRQIWNITLPAIRSTVVILLILRMGSVLDNGFDQLFLLSNAGNRSVSDVFDLFTYREGIINGRYSYTTAIGLFKSVVGMALIFGANKLAKMAGETGIF